MNASVFTVNFSGLQIFSMMFHSSNYLYPVLICSYSTDTGFSATGFAKAVVSMAV